MAEALTAQTAVGLGLRDWGTWDGTSKSPSQGGKAGFESPRKKAFFHTSKALKIIPIVKKNPYSISRPRVAHTIVHQEYQCGIRVVEQPYLHVEGSPQQFLQGPVILRVIAAILCI